MAAWATPGGGPGNPQELNRYSYALNNPARYTDPTGHCADPITLTLCVVAVGAVLVSGSLVAVNASSTAAQTASGASAAPVAEQILADLTPFWLDVAMTAGPELAETLVRAAADDGQDEESEETSSTAPQPPEAVQDLLSRTKPYRGEAKNLDYAGSHTPDEEFDRIAEPGSVRPHPQYAGGRVGKVPGGGTIGLRPVSRDTGAAAIDLHNVPGLPTTTKVKWPQPK